MRMKERERENPPSVHSRKSTSVHASETNIFLKKGNQIKPEPGCQTEHSIKN